MKKLIYLIKQPITLKKLISIAVPLELIRKGKIKRVALDSLTIFKYGTDDEMSYRKEVLDLVNNMRKVLFLATAEENRGGIDNLYSAEEDYLFDGIIRMIKVRRSNNFERCIFIDKVRGQDHLLDIFPFTIKSNGIIVHSKEIPFSLVETGFNGKK